MDVVRSWVAGHKQDRKHLGGTCLQDDIATSRNCLPADLVGTGVDGESEEETEPIAGPGPEESEEDDHDSLLEGEIDSGFVSPGTDPGESEDDECFENLMEEPGTDEEKLDPVTPRKGKLDPVTPRKGKG